jgi:hypothetical protein
LEGRSRRIKAGGQSGKSEISYQKNKPEKAKSLRMTQSPILQKKIHININTIKGLGQYRTFLLGK